MVFSLGALALDSRSVRKWIVLLALAAAAAPAHAGLPTSTTVLSSANPSAQGQMVTFTATVFAASGTPTGTIVFADGTTPIGTAQLVDRRASFSTSGLAAGTHSITATYQGDAAYDGSVSPPLNQMVAGAPGTPTTTSLASTQNPSTAGQLVTFTATVSCPGGSPSGTVQFFRDGVYFAFASLNGNQAVVQTSDLTEGSHAITADYSGGSGCAGSTSAPLVQVVNAAPRTATSINLVSSPNPSVAGDPVTFTATVSSSAGPPPGFVQFTDGGVQIGTAALVNGKAAFSTAALAVGTHLVRAWFAGDATFAASSSATLSQLVRSADTRPAFTSSANPSAFGQPVVFQAQFDPACTGTAAFLDGSAWQASAPISPSGTAYWTATALSTGSHQIAVVYAGGAICPTSSAATLSQVVAPAQTITVMSAEPAPEGGFTLTAKVEAVPPGGGVPSGTVVFRDGGAVIATAALNAQGVAAATAPLNAAVEHAVTAEYQGGPNHAPSASLRLGELNDLSKPYFESAYVVNSASYAAGLAPGAFSTVFGARLAGATAMASPPYPDTLAGVQVRINGAPVPVVFVSSRQINFLAPASLAPGTAEIVVSNSLGTSQPVTVDVHAALPGIFYDVASGYGAILIAGTADTTLTRPAAAGEYLEIYCTGLGGVDETSRTSLPVTVGMGQLRLEPVYAGLNPVFPGLYQVNVQVPAGLTGEQTLTLEAGGRSSNAVKVRVQ